MALPYGKNREDVIDCELFKMASLRCIDIPHDNLLEAHPNAAPKTAGSWISFMDGQRILPMLRLKLAVETEDGSWLEPARIRLLELIAEHGSIAAGAREMGISYRHAWLRVDAMSKGLGRPVLTTRPGGTGGGGASLTAGGNALIGCYRQLETDLQLATNVTLARLLILITR